MKEFFIVIGCVLLLTTLLFSQMEIPDRSLLRKMDAQKYNRFKYQALYEDSLHMFDAQKYIVDMWIDIPNDTIWAIFQGIVESKADTLSTIKVHLIALTIDSILVRGSKVTFSRPDTHLIINLPSTIPNGDTVSYTVFYHGEPVVGGGIFGGGLTINDTITYADNEPYGAKRWMPIYDLPSDKAYLETTFHVPSGYTAISNGVLIDSTVSGPWWSFHWRENHTIANYLIVVAASNQFAVLTDTFNYSTYTMPIWHWVSREDSLEMETRFGNTPDMLFWFSETYGIYPFIDEKYAHVGTPIGGAMEDQTNTFFNTDANWGSDWDWVIAHELAHQWWGDWVTCGTWKDIWLNEGFATFSEAHYFWHRDGEQAYHNYMRDWIMNYYINHEPYPPYPMYDPDFLFSVVTYEKGAAVLHMLRHIVGDSLYFELLKQYGVTYAEGSAVTGEFTIKVEEVTGLELDWFFDQWVYKAGYPKYEYGWWVDTLAADSFRVSFHLWQVQSHNWNVPTFIMPIDIYVEQVNGDTLKSVINDSLDYQSFTLYTSAAPTNVMFDPGNWVLKTAVQIPVGMHEDAEKRDRKAISVYPNPAYRNVNILFGVGQTEPFTICIYDISGREVKRFEERTGKTVWNLTNKNDRKIGTGVYFIQCERNNKVIATSKVLVLLAI